MAHRNRVAISQGARCMTYGELADASADYASRLRSTGVRPEDRVLIGASRDFETLVAVLGTLRAGAAFVPVEASIPDRRLEFIAAQTLPRVVHVTSSGDQRLTRYGRVASADKRSPESLRAAPSVPREESAAYVMYTSGSTGRPKGVIVTHVGLTNYVRWAARVLPRGGPTLLHSPLTFDFSLTSLFVPLVRGDSVELWPDDAAIDGVFEALTQREFSFVRFTPTHVQLLSDLDLGRPLRVRAFLIGGERLHWRHVDILRRLAPEAAVWNHYGPTETVIGRAAGLVVGHQATSSVPIGRSIDNTSIYVLDASWRHVSEGDVGELAIAGRGIARGYLDAPGPTAARFVPDPYSAQPGARMYLTGDLGRRLSDGTFEVIGRADDELKINGMRVHPAEIEHGLCEHADITAAVVRDLEMNGRKRPVAFFVSARPLDPLELRHHLAERLPVWMLPHRYLQLAELPRTENGKIDVGQLSEKAAATPVDVATSHSEALSEGASVEARLQRIWQDVLGVRRIGRHDDFFALGGDSIAAVRVVARARRAGINLGEAEIFDTPTIAALASSSIVERQERESPSLPFPMDVLTMTPIQHWFCELSLAQPDTYLHCVDIAFPTEVSQDFARRAFRHVAEQHPALRLTFDVHERQQRVNTEGGRWLTRPSDIGRSIDLSGGPIFEGGAVGQCVIRLAAHHLAVDVISWDVIVTDFIAAYEADVAGRQVDTPPGDAYAAWVNSIAEQAHGNAAVLDELTWWTSQAPTYRGSLMTSTPLANVENWSISLDIAQTERLLAYSRSLECPADRIVVAAVVHSLANLTGESRITMDLEWHGREFAGSGPSEISRVVGWHTALFPLAIGVHADSVEGVANRVRERFREVPSGGRGFGILKYLSNNETRNALKQMAPSRVRYNHLGTEVSSYGLSSSQHATTTLNHPPAPRFVGQPPYLLDFLSVIRDGSLQLRCAVRAREREVAGLSVDIERRLQNIPGK